MKSGIAFVALVCLSASPALAGDLGPAVAPADLAADTGYDTHWLTPKISTLGVGIEAGTRWSDHWGARANVNFGSFDYTYNDRHADLDSRASLFSTGLIADYYPNAGDLRLSAGARLSASKIEGDVRNLVKHGKNYTVTIVDPLTHYTVRQNVIQPFLGAGYSYRIKDRVTLDFDIGALYAGSPDLDVNSHAQRFGFTRHQIDNEIERQRDRISQFQIYPVVEVGLKIRF